jgi:hypothetical protein
MLPRTKDGHTTKGRPITLALDFISKSTVRRHYRFMRRASHDKNKIKTETMQLEDTILHRIENIRV